MIAARYGLPAALLILAACSSGGGSGDVFNPEPPGDDYVPPPSGFRTDESVDVDGKSRYFDVYVPTGLRENAPVVVLLHGGGQNKAVVVDGSSGSGAWLDVSDDAGFLLLVPNGADEFGDPQASSARWNDCRSDQVTGSSEDDVAFIAALLDWAFSQAEFRLDPQRVYATGASNGGLMSYRLALELGDRIAAIAAFVANNPLNYDDDCLDAVSANPREPVSVFICNGTADVLMPFFGGEVAVGTGGVVDSTFNTVDFWRNWNGTSLSLPPFQLPDLDPADGSTVVASDYVGGAANTAVRFYTVVAGGHTIPSLEYFSSGAQNRDIEGAREAWAFLATQRR